MMKQKKSVLVGWAFSYVIILLIPIITIFINYTYSIKVIRQETYQANELVLDNLSDSFDRFLNEEASFYAYLYQEATFFSLISSKEKDAQFYADAATMKNQIAAYSSNTPNMTCLLYFDNFDYVIDNSGANSSKNYYNTLKWIYPDIVSYEEWMDFLEKEYKNQFLKGKYVHYKTNEECIIYATGILKSGYEPVNIFISIPVSAIEPLTQSLSEGSSFLVSVDGELMLALSNEGMQEISDEMTAICNSGERQDFEMQGQAFEIQDYMVIRSDSGRKEVQYYLLIPQGEFWRQLQYLRNVLCISIVITLLVGFICVSILLNRNFRPISNLTTKIVGSDQRKGNEYKLIEGAYARLVGENDNMHKLLLNQKEAMQSNYLLTVMKGRKVEENESIIRMEGKQKVILIVFSVPLYDEKQILHDELMLFVVDNIFSELMQGSCFYRIEEGQYLFYLLVIEEGEEELRRKHCLEQTEYLCSVMGEKWKLSVLAAVSGIEEGLDSIRFQYQDVMEAFEDRKMLGGTGVIDILKKYQSEEGNKRLVKSIIDYVEKHYADANLNITTIADNLGKNPKYISKIFKDETQEGILDYISRMRIVKAQALMRTRQYSLEEVSLLSGYASLRTFRRAFVKITGVTPGKYMDDQEDKK